MSISIIVLILSVFILSGCATPPSPPQVVVCDTKGYIPVSDTNDIIDLTNDLIEIINECDNQSIRYLPYYRED